MTQVAEKNPKAGPEGRARKLTFCIFGGATDCYNLGVAALGTGTITGLKMGFPEASIVVQTYDAGNPRARVQLADETLELPSVQVWSHNNLRDRTSISHLRAAGRITRRLGAWSAGYNRALKALTECDVIMDISGGDSFADIYGDSSFDYQAAVKLLARDLNKPLVLLPQTFGPFTRPESIAGAREILEYATLSATREVEGIEEMRRVFGTVPGHVVNSPDVAFLMKPARVAPEREPFLHAGAGEPLIGLNVSGLLYFKERAFGMEALYRALMEGLADWAIRTCGGRLLLVPHVISDKKLDGDLLKYDSTVEASDTLACMLLQRELEKRYPGRVGCLSWPYGPAETKFCIGHCDFFIGARMHACIGAISQAVPTVTLAYSKKALGVMSHLNMADSVVDLRTLSVDESLAAIDQLYQRRADLHGVVAGQVPLVQGRVAEFFTKVMPAALRSVV